MKPLLGQALDGTPIPIDVDKLVASRMLLTANSGGGKSWALRRLLEQTHGSIQQLVLDPEGEFFTLREQFDYVLAGKGGDCPAEPRSAGLLARKLLELRTSAIVDLFDLVPRERVRFVRLFVEALLDAPRALWHPVLIVIDEAHKFAPEAGHGTAESNDAVCALMSQGRKRGHAGVLATQRLSKLSKDAAAEANNVLIGRTVLDVDVKRAGPNLGLTPAQAFAQLTQLEPGTFFGYGPALVGKVTGIKVGDVRTSHPEAGKGSTKPPPPRERVRKILGQLADLPAEAAAEARTLEEAHERIKVLEHELAAAKRAQPKPEVKRVEVPAIAPKLAARFETMVDRLAKAADQVTLVALDVTGGLAAAAGAHTTNQAVEGRASQGTAPQGPGKSPPPVSIKVQRPASPPPVFITGRPSNPYMQDLIDALARLQALGRDWIDRRRWAALAGKSPRSSSFEKHVAGARAAGLVEYGTGGTVRLTELGLAQAMPVDKVPTGKDLAEAFKAHVLEPAQGRLLDVMMEAPGPLTREELGERAGQSPRSSSFEKHVAGLRALGLIEYGPAGSKLLMLGESVKVA